MKESDCERESTLQGWEGIELMTVSGARDFKFIGRELYKRAKELRNDRSVNLSLVEMFRNKGYEELCVVSI